MSMRLKIAQFYCPVFVKKQKLSDLFSLTAQAFKEDPPHLIRKSLDECLKHYALFTKAAAEKVLQNKSMSQKIVKSNLYKHTYQMGQKIKKQLGLRTFEDALKASRFLYNMLGIDFEGNQDGEIIIRQCYFSQFYSSQVCELISALDEGMLAGISGGGKLTFCQRITEGKDCCKANLEFNGNES